MLRLLAKKLTKLGFERTKPTFFTRNTQHVLEFVHVHKFTFGPSFRVHFGLRVRSDDFPAAHLNGLSSEQIADATSPNRRRYRFEFDTYEASWELCAEEMYQCTSEEGMQWFGSMNDTAILLSSASPLTTGAKAALRWELENPSSVQSSEATQRALNAA